MLPVSETIRSRSKTYSLSWATERSAYLTAPMPTWGAIAARTSGSRSGRASSMTASGVRDRLVEQPHELQRLARPGAEDLAVLAEHVADLDVHGVDRVGQPAGLAGGVPDHVEVQRLRRADDVEDAVGS